MNSYYFFVNYGLIIIGSLITLCAQAFINIAYSRYSRIRNDKSITGSDIARYILDKNGLQNIKVVEISGSLTDHYDPIRKVVRLSSMVYKDASIASLAVAAHECGHAIQDKVGFFMMRLRAILVPFVNFASYAGYISIVVGLIFSFRNLLWIGILMELLILLFQLVTLPVEIDASRRALKELKSYKLITSTEVNGSRAVLIAAASTYVASVATNLLQILRLVLIFSNRDDR